MARPSSLPALEKCSRFVSGSSDYCEPGQDRHAALAAYLTGDETQLDLLTEDEADAVRWAGDYVKLKSIMDQWPLVLEYRIAFVKDDFSEWFAGTVDAACGHDVFDFKWRPRDYTAQMAAYALLRMQETEFDTMRIHVLYGERKRVEVLEFTWDSAMAIVKRIQDRADAPTGEPTPNDYCNWCAARLTCPAYLDRANAVKDGREEWGLKNYHASEIQTEDEMSKALTLARLLKKWIASVEFHAMEMVQKQGKLIPGFELSARQGKKTCVDVAAAFAALGLTQEEFLAGCDLRLVTSAKYPDRRGIVNIFAASNELKQAPAKRQVEAKLEGILKPGNQSYSLKAVNSNDDETE
jgi:hypothetical protein